MIDYKIRHRTWLYRQGESSLADRTRQTIAACKTELATNFEEPAERILRFHGSKIGLSVKEMEQLLRDIIQEQIQ